MSRVASLWLTDFRCYRHAEVAFGSGVTAIVGGNGQGKTSLLEAIHWLATARSLREVPNRTLVKSGAETAIIRGIVATGTREHLIEAELHAQGRDRVLLNRRRLQRARELLGVLRVTVFAPDDLELVKGGPAHRRDYLDDLLVALAPRYEAVRSELEKVLKHRNALLRRGVRDPSDRATLEVFDEQLVATGAELVRGRLGLIEELLPRVRDAYGALAGGEEKVSATYRADWSAGEGLNDVESALRAAVARDRGRELERGTSLVGPHRDDWEMTLDALDARHRSSQGEQRTLALALRLGGHHCVAAAVGEEPVLLLDDVFSELDTARARALVHHLPSAQTLVTTAVPLPAAIEPDGRLEVGAGLVERVS